MVLVPIFFEDEIVGFSSMFGHMMDVGGPVPGSMPTAATSIFGEGLKIPPIKIRDTGDEDLRFSQEEADRVQEFRKCIECFLCQNVCHVIREHDKKEEFGGPRFFVRVAGLEMHPLDEENRLGLLKNELGIGYCNITKCCTEVCPESIAITDNAIIPLKERVVDEFYDPVKKLFRVLFS